MPDSEVLITGDPSKLPTDIAGLLDPSIPLPEGVVFFETRYELSTMFRTFLIAIGLALGAVIVIPFGIAVLFDHSQVTVNTHVDYLPLGFGLVLGLGAWMMLASLGTAWRFRKLQKLGQCTRRGTFLLSDRFVHASENDTTVIPPNCFRGLSGGSVKYHHNNLEKSFRLPSLLINSTPEQLQKAITDWAGRHVM